MQHIRDVEQLGQALRDARRAQGLTQAQFAALAGVGTRFVSELERGKATAEVGLVLRVLTDAGIDVFVAPRGG